MSQTTYSWIEANGIVDLVAGLERLPRPSDENGGMGAVLRPIDDAAVNGEDYIHLPRYPPYPCGRGKRRGGKLVARRRSKTGPRIGGYESASGVPCVLVQREMSVYDRDDLLSIWFITPPGVLEGLSN